MEAARGRSWGRLLGAWRPRDGRGKRLSALAQRGVVLACLTSSGNGLSATPSLGHALFVGKVPLAGRISSHPRALPPEVVRCSNCHAVGDGPEVPATQAPRLTRAWLTAPRPRRGGPPSKYSLPAFCTLLRTGTDPAYVLISEQMPRYTISDDQCKALWGYVTTAQASPR
jgi:hypothetical protein